MNSSTFGLGLNCIINDKSSAFDALVENTRFSQQLHSFIIQLCLKPTLQSMLFVAENFNEGGGGNTTQGEGIYIVSTMQKKVPFYGGVSILLSVILFKNLLRKHRKTIITKIPMIPN